MNTSQPFCCKTRSVAQWVGRNMASATQPTKKATRARFRPTAGRNRGSFGPGFDRRRQQRNHAPQPAGNQLQQAQPLGQVEQPDLLHQPHGHQQLAHPVGVGEQSEEDQFAEPVVFHFRPPIGLLDRQAERLDQPAVAHARRAGRFAGPAIEAQFQVPAHAVGQRGAAVGHHPHQLDAAAGAVVLVAHLGERRTTRRAQPAVNAAQEQIVADSRGRVRCFGWIELSEPL